mmetsp:Transcript_57053/g.128380  ORF Transcript_57053/g.128380 Transcript_57053/m.128380 type:complete len:247 (+) Transcript_57053:418-1158(+)
MFSTTQRRGGDYVLVDSVHHLLNLLRDDEELRLAAALGVPLQGQDALDELLPVDLGHAVAHHEEELRDLLHIQLHERQDVPHPLVLDHHGHLLDADESVPRLVDLPEHLLQQPGVLHVAPLLVHDGDLVVHGDAVGFRYEDGVRHVHQGHAEGATVEEDEDAPPLADVYHEPSRRGSPIAEGDLAHGDHHARVCAEQLVDLLALKLTYRGVLHVVERELVDQHAYGRHCKEHDQNRPHQCVPGCQD